MHKNFITIIIFIFILFLSPVKFSVAQLPEWTLIEDKDGNRYYIDKNGKIWTSAKPEFDYKPVSIEGLDYYLNQGIELLKNHYKTEGLILLKSILALPVKNNSVYDAQVKASKEINNLLKIEGTRFKQLNENAALLLFKSNDAITLINDNMLYSVKSPFPLKIISRRVREKSNYKYFGLLLGFRFKNEDAEDKKNYSSYDLLLAIDSESFPYPVKKAINIEKQWRNRLGSDTLKRVMLKKNDNEIIYSYEDTHLPNYSGIEGFYSKMNFGYYLKAITSVRLFQKNKTRILEIVNNFKI